MPEMHTSKLFGRNSNDSESQQTVFQYSRQISQDFKDADWLLCNSFYEIEQPACELVGSVLPIGPLIEGRRHGRFGGNFWKEDSTCLNWLDKQSPCSVIYVAFGSLAIFNRRQFQELALGLELSGQCFLWVVRPGLTDGSDAAYPDGFVARVADRGHIVGWSPPKKVLAHPSIACFFTHCGWKSTLEGLSNGVPFLCWPYFADQFINKANITAIWKVGLEVNPDNNDIISREEIKRKLEELVGNKEIRARSLKIQAAARESTGENGSSLINLNMFIEAIKSKSS